MIAGRLSLPIPMTTPGIFLSHPGNDMFASYLQQSNVGNYNLMSSTTTVHSSIAATTTFSPPHASLHAVGSLIFECWPNSAVCFVERNCAAADHQLVQLAACMETSSVMYPFNRFMHCKKARRQHHHANTNLYKCRRMESPRKYTASSLGKLQGSPQHKGSTRQPDGLGPNRTGCTSGWDMPQVVSTQDRDNTVRTRKYPTARSFEQQHHKVAPGKR